MVEQRLRVLTPEAAATLYPAKTSLAAVATSGSYNDLTNKPAAGSGGTGEPTGLSDATLRVLGFDPTVQETFPLSRASTTAGTATGRASFTFFTAHRSATRTGIRVATGSTAATGTPPTLTRFGLYSVDASGNLALIASTPNDVALLVTVNVVYTKAFSATVDLVAGNRYALAELVVTTGTVPNFQGAGPSTSSNMAKDGLALAGFLASQADLPASTTVAAMSGTNPFYAKLY